MVVRLIAGDLTTGFIRATSMPVTRADVDCSLGSIGTIRAAMRIPWYLPFPDGGREEIRIADVIVPTKSFIGWDIDGEILEAGPIWEDSWDAQTGTLSWTAAGLESLGDYRFVMQALVAGQYPRDTSLAWTTSLRTHAKRLWQNTLTHIGGQLPIVFEDDITGTADRTYQGADKVKLAQATANLRGVANGPDIVLRPRYQTDRRYIEWQLLTGNPLLVQAGDDHVWDLTVPSSVVTALQITRNGRKITTLDIETGTVVDNILQEAWARDQTLTDASFPAMEAATTRGSVSYETTLQDHADGEVFIGRTHEVTVSFTVPQKPIMFDPVHGFIRTGPWLGTYREGHYCQLVLPPNPYVPAGRTRHRIMSISAGLDNTARITCVPERIGGGYPTPTDDVAYFRTRLRSLQDAVDESTRGQ